MRHFDKILLHGGTEKYGLSPSLLTKFWGMTIPNQLLFLRPMVFGHANVWSPSVKVTGIYDNSSL